MTRSPVCWLLKGLLLFHIGLIHAQAACPPGTIPYGTGQGQETCGPDGSQNQTSTLQQPPQPPPPLWESRWGAIATDAENGSLGTATNMRSKHDAVSTAIADCQSKGGVHCKLQIAYDNECAAMVLGDKVFDVAADATVEKAVTAGMNSCSAANDHTCRVYYSACSLPVQIQ